ncbi:exopolysaccharide biosynthesis protein (plasmid) [Rhizobium acidisoli]|uniref:Exopolysaccharide biosynthesis protein n=2 Tax=Rhizobium acidisoli TaxID=1538158 RepID=A0AAE5WSV6_9HYPH|nr:exopolysaccharide biosynthesis protein [Rhizobium acidisoli]QAS81872.1 exopolysaccharide biosynthesis protein [Rhizobium acidisoli]
MRGRSEQRWQSEGIASSRLRELAALGQAEGSIEIGKALSLMGQAGTTLVILLLTLPALTPIPGPFGMVFGTALALVALQIASGCETIWLPASLRRRHLSSGTIDVTLRYAGPLIVQAEKFTHRDRLAVLTRKPVQMLLGFPIFLLAIAIALPIPFGNFLPAFALIVIAVALLERDGLVTLIGLILSVAALAATAALAYGTVTAFV